MNTNTFTAYCLGKVTGLVINLNKAYLNSTLSGLSAKYARIHGLSLVEALNIDPSLKVFTFQCALGEAIPDINKLAQERKASKKQAREDASSDA